MNVRRFTAPGVNQALAKVKEALGEDAVILRTRKIKRGGLFTFLSSDLMEVTAASPDRKPIPKEVAPDRAAKVRGQLKAHPGVDKIGEFQEELTQLKGDMRDLVEQVKFERMPSLPPSLSNYYKGMVRSGLDEKMAAEIAQQINIRYNGDELENNGLVESEIKAALKERIPIGRISRKRGKRTRVIALVGPTGVGKTTTIAKLATSYRFWGKTETALVSADTYRVAALEQLKTFAAIAGIPMEAVYQPEAMSKVLARHQDRSAIFIDTAGRSQADRAKLDELADFLEAAKPDELLLCLAVSTRLEDQLDIIERYRKLKPTGVVFTKLDESRGPGMIPTVLEKADLSAVYLTCGQSVPDDIIGANAGKLAELILAPDRLQDNRRSLFEDWIDDEKKTISREDDLARQSS